ncbi:hypothetical protein GA0115235_110512 [Streptomyces sp. DpondAA-F4a]|nr:hypothetical protein K351_02398 [Streptomyces sp. DpondAA-E10]RAJ50608.1 hypothetical protein K352_01793 [Streptomyces sp. DpondAA-A50]SCD98483.1 hypothetical protein GA0115235_110512 [Streptomyces sp. DpondAA-F4a]SCM04309.1 hypothetical protein SAMN04883147_106656 [Streptomyces sp. DpondAA-F4]
MPTIMEILRHTQITQTRRYAKGRSTLAKDAVRRMGDAFTPATEPVTETRTATPDSTRAAPPARPPKRRKPRSECI